MPLALRRLSFQQGPRNGSVILPDQVVTAEFDARGDLFRTDLNDATADRIQKKSVRITMGKLADATTCV